MWSVYDGFKLFQEEKNATDEMAARVALSDDRRQVELSEVKGRTAR